MRKLFSKMFDINARELKKIDKIVDSINSLEPEYSQLSDDALQAKTATFKSRIAEGQSLDDLLPEAFAVVRETSKRVLGLRPYDVQLCGGISLHQGRVAEMKTGEGKTLAATMPAYLNALGGKGVHVVTVNDYLASRDSEWMGQIYSFLGLEVGLIVHGLTPAERKASYEADITYGTNNEFGFDYLRDNMAVRAEDFVQRPLNYAIIDEVDSILIDEARTPLIISGSTDVPTDLYQRFSQIARTLKPEDDYIVDEKARSVSPTEAGVAKVERMLNVENLYDDTHIELSHYLTAALKARSLMQRDRDYIVKDDEVIIVDDFTGRLMFGRRYSQGLHQAIEAKENVPIAKESQTLATITLQNYFRMYTKLAGMTGTAKTEEEELRSIYGMDVLVIPTNKPMIREDYPDAVYKTERAKFVAVTKEISKRHDMGQPVLVGTVSIAKSEELSSMLKDRDIPHQVLNAKYHEQEAEIIKHAGQEGMVTIATNMAGRGTDIVLGAGVPQKGGLHVLGTERHEARRIDNQLRGRSGRQGDMGSSQFYISLEDDLMRLFGSESMAGIMDKLGMEEDIPIEHALLSKAIEAAQKKVEGRNYNIRKYVLEYDDVMNKQREVIYTQRRRVVEGEGLGEQIESMIGEIIDRAISIYAPADTYPEDWDLEGLVNHLSEYFLLPQGLPAQHWVELTQVGLTEELTALGQKAYQRREADMGTDIMSQLEKMIMLRVVDRRWMDHIDAMEDLRQGIGLRAYGGSNPLIEYQKEAYDMFNAMISEIRDEVVKYVFRAEVGTRPIMGPVAQEGRAIKDSAPATSQTSNEKEAPKQVPVRSVKIGRNEPCPCGSGKKYKKCCGG